MRRAVPLLAVALAACGGHTAQPAAPAPSAGSRPGAASADPAVLRYAPGASRYRMEVVSQVVQEVMGQTTDVSLTQNLLLSTSLSADGADLVLSVTVDSVSIVGNSPGVDANALNRARGSTTRVTLTPSGQPAGTPAPPDSNAVMQQLRRTFSEFLGTLPPGGLAPGTTWTDTINQTGTLPGGSGQTTSRSIRQHRVAGWESHDGTRALRISTTGTFAVSGQGDVQGSPIELTGTGTANGDRWVSGSGVYLGSVSADSANLTVTVTSMGMVIPIRQASRTTVTRLP